MYGMAGLFGQIVVATALGLILRRSIFSEIDTNVCYNAVDVFIGSFCVHLDA